MILLVPLQAEALQRFKLATSEYEPFSSSRGGLAMDVVSAALAAVGAEPEFVFLPWKRCELCVEQGECLGAFPYSSNDQRRESFIFSEPILESRAVFFMRAARLPAWDFQGMASLRGLTAACVPGYFYEETFARGGIECVTVKNTHYALRMLLAGRIDLVVESEAIGWMELERLEPEPQAVVRTAPTPMRSGVSAVMSRKGSAEAERFQELFNRGLRLIRNDGTYAEIYRRYNLSIPGQPGSLPGPP